MNVRWWMDSMAAEFDRLDTNKSGELDSAELSRSRLRVSFFLFPPSQKHSARNLPDIQLFPLAATVIQLRCIPWVIQLVFVDLPRYAS
jgi:hypothetical protein